MWLCWAVPHGHGHRLVVLGAGPAALAAVPALTLCGRWPPSASRWPVSLLIAVAATGVEVTGPGPSFPWMLLVVLTTTPLQAAAEEYVFRGYLSQAIAGWIGRPRPARWSPRW